MSDRDPLEYPHFKDRLKALRVAHGLSQRELASRCTTVSYAYISRLEAGTRTPSVKAIRQLAEALGVTADEMEFGEKSIKANPTFRSMQRRIVRLEQEKRALELVVHDIDFLRQAARSAERLLPILSRRS